MLAIERGEWVADAPNYLPLSWCVLAVDLDCSALSAEDLQQGKTQEKQGHGLGQTHKGH